MERRPFIRKGDHLILDTIPTWVCAQCSEAYFEEAAPKDVWGKRLRWGSSMAEAVAEAPDPCPAPGRTLQWSRRPEASAPASLRLPGAAHRGRHEGESRLILARMGGVGYGPVAAVGTAREGMGYGSRLPTALARASLPLPAAAERQRGAMASPMRALRWGRHTYADAPTDGSYPLFTLSP